MQQLSVDADLIGPSAPHAIAEAAKPVELARLFEVVSGLSGRTRSRLIGVQFPCRHKGPSRI
jgi:hypothetical protein